jgi:anti-sigma factor (TIGR02949 family)
MSCEIVDRDLAGYIDHEIDAESAQAVREHLSACEGCRARVDEHRAVGRLVRTVPYYSAPNRLRARIAAQTTRSMMRHRLLTWAAAAALVVAVAGGVVGVRSVATGREAIVEEAVNGHVRSLMADHLFDVRSTDQHTVKPWFLGKLDFAPPVVDLAASGFPLVGGRLDYLSGRPVAALVYQRGQHTINVFVFPDERTLPAIDARTIRGFHVRHWVRDGMSFWAVSDLNETELTAFAHALAAS